jgi:surface protein
MFYSCSSLIILDISSFNLSKLQNAAINSENIEFIRLNNSIIDNSTSYINLTFKTKKNAVICIDGINDDNNLQLINQECQIFYCSSDWRSKRKKINKENNTCVDNCSIIPYNYEYNGECHNNCPNSNAKLVEYSNNLCANFCPIEQPFYFINEQRCVSFCNIKQLNS